MWNNGDRQRKKFSQSGTCPVVPYFSTKLACCLDNVLRMGELSLAKSPHPVDRTGATASIMVCIDGGGTGSVAAGAATGAGATGAAGVATGAAATATGATAGAFSGAGAATTGGATAGTADFSRTKSAKAATSPKSSTVTMMGVPTGISAPEPASMRILAVHGLAQVCMGRVVVEAMMMALLMRSNCRDRPVQSNENPKHPSNSGSQFCHSPLQVSMTTTGLHTLTDKPIILCLKVN
jgi:hypothetical protein